MGFWSVTTAAPQWWLTLFPTKPGYLRNDPVEPVSSPFTIRRASPAISAHISAFWNTYYCGSDWYMDTSVEWVENYLRDPEVILLYAHDSSYTIMATIVSSPVSKKPVVMSHGARIPLRCIEGLCLADSVRGQGIAAIMISAIDSYTSKSGPCAHIWSRELPLDPGIFTTAASIKTYAYILSNNAQLHRRHTPLRITNIPWSTFMSTWNPYRYVVNQTSTIISELPLNRNNGLDVWNVEYKGKNTIVVVLHTQRKTRSHKPILEIIWSSSHTDLKTIHTHVSAQYNDCIMFTTDADGSWSPEWVYGQSGVHATYLYNYLPPEFRNTELILIREEI